ncbi:MAG: HAMP domain-containing histidine kinase [Proteobacteria bacterium]|nr:HAMP domain-containing histidine kinase [Pseudomonadota bacterium]
MKRLYAKFALGILISVCVGFLLVFFGIKPFVDRHVNESFLAETAAKATGIMDQMAARPAGISEQESLHRIADLIDYPLAFVPVDDVDAALRPLDGLPGVYYAGELAGIQSSHAAIYTPVDGDQTFFVQGPMRLPLPPRGALIALWMPLVFSMVISLSGAAILVIPLMRRLRRLDRGIRAIHAKRFKTQIEVDSGDAVGQLAANFNEMAARVSRLFREREELMQAVLHELGTPLSRMRLHVELLRQNPPDASRDRHLRSLEDEMSELDELTSELVGWIEASALPDQTGHTDAHRVIEQSVAYCQELYDVDVELHIDGQSDGNGIGWVRADQRLFQRAVDNMLRNAGRYAKTRIVVAAGRVNRVLRLEIRDDGPGVPEEHRERIFEPFTRVEPSRSREHGGIGLGLAIVKRIVERCGGRVEVSGAREGGAAFITTWHTAPPPLSPSVKIQPG